MPGMSMYSRDDLDDMKGMMDEYGYGDEDGYGYGDDEEGMEGINRARTRGPFTIFMK